MSGTTITPAGLAAVFKAIEISDDSDYRAKIKGTKEEVEKALAAVNGQNLDFAVGLVAKAIQRSTGISDAALAAVREDLSGYVDKIVRANVTKSYLDRREETLNGIVANIREETKDSFSTGLDHIKKNPELLNLIVGLKVQTLAGSPGFDNPYASGDDLKEAIIAKITAPKS